ncbi:hypothetical protein SAMN04488552_0077 [Christiangramia echinicola]|uniref:Uncharacterized protein n=1 Tax=Christiangramia echinicola TaxID=279359 RepID=A0A1H1KS72_9FLAO|nr:hypothetical protein SAMN04488552_0077 [Christiangramia echinicola]
MFVVGKLLLKFAPRKLKDQSDEAGNPSGKL